MATLDTAERIQEEARKRESYNSERNKAMDRWLGIYLLMDEEQDQKPKGQTRYKTPMPKSLVKRAIQILTRNPIHPHVVYGRELEDERETIRKVELFGTGLFNDINQLLVERLDPRAEAQAAWYALVRGWICSQLWFTKESDRESPVTFQLWDPRYVYPRRDANGLHSVLAVFETDLGACMEEYEDAPLDDWDPQTPVKKYVKWDRKRYTVVADYRNPKTSKQQLRTLVNMEHQLSRIPVQIVPVNGDPITQVPPSLLRSYGTSVTDTGAFDMPQARKDPTTPRSWTAGQGQSIFSTVERAIPQLNHLVSILSHAGYLSAYPTLTFMSRDGSPKEIAYGTGIVNYLSRQSGEEIVVHQGPPLPAGLMDLLGVYARDVSLGTLPTVLLEGAAATSGFDRAQMINQALTSLGAFGDGLDLWQAQVIQSGLRQIKDFPQAVTFQGSNPSARNTFFEVTFQPGELTRMYQVEIERTPAVPDDMMMRAQLAQALTNPARPLMSIQTVLDVILKMDDVDGEISKIFEDMALLHPAIVAKRLEKVLIERGQMDLLPYVQNEEVIQSLQQEIQKTAAQGQLAQLSGGMPGGPPANPGAPGVSPGAMPPEMGNPMSEQGRQLMGPGGGY